MFASTGETTPPCGVPSVGVLKEIVLEHARLQPFVDHPANDAVASLKAENASRGRGWPDSAPGRVEQFEQRQASVERCAEEAGAGEEPAGTFCQEAGRAGGSARRDLAVNCRSRWTPSTMTRWLAPGAVARSSIRTRRRRPQRPAGVRSARAAASRRHRTSCCTIADAPLAARNTRAPFPDGVNAPVQYGPWIGAFVLVSSALPVVAREASGRVNGRSPRGELVTATIARISQDCARRFQGFADVVR